MAEKLSFALFSPDGIFGQSEVCSQVSVPGKCGEFILMANSMPCLVALKRGFVKIEHADGMKSKYYISGGLCQISNDGKLVSVFSEHVVDACDDKALQDCMSKISSHPITFSDSATLLAQKLH